ncbi:protein-disulfide reductase DsbD family protein [Aurantibacter aestuarii]|uniref:Thiol:disulfide interchange protein n=1 Tax=Aurantibacter aestuarii TaxID=1266046 RepID=A0A2T1N969_9FLAO|nr:thioredoxin family protein [Aurantibacter aestuarii]PSG88420.1 thiol:disulfide interchange protein [Aurantibacter aestuarii]
MKQFIALIILLLAFTFSNAQVLNPVKWSSSVEKISETEYNLVFKADIKEHWHLYTQKEIEGGNLPTEFVYDSLASIKDFKLIGKATESESITSFDKVFALDLNFFEDKAVFKQKIEVLNQDLKTIEAEILYQACDDVSCIYPSKQFTFTLSEATAVKEDASQAEVSEEKVKEDKTSFENQTTTDGRSLWSTFFIAFILGFGVLLTPCVFPMIPMTVSFFTKQSKDRSTGIKNAFLYGFFIIVIYTALGTIVSTVFGSNAMYEFSTGVIFNTIMFIVLVLFAFSFMGAFEIMLPNSFMNKVDSQSNRGGIIGIFFMALALAVVSFSCTFPIAGTALLEAVTVGGIAPIISMLGFSTAIAIPFVLFAVFPGWLNGLPKSGGWLNTVKVVLGFLELAFAFKFLSMIDLVLDWHFLEREVFIAIWIAIFGTLGLYLLGKIKLPHDSPLAHISVGRLSLAIIVLAFTFYMIPGLWGAPLKLISGFPPPMSTHSESPYGVGFTKKQLGVPLTTTNTNSKTLPEHAHYGPNDIVAFHDYDKGMAYAKEIGKPVMLDFTGLTCVNCRKMEEQVWVDDKIFNILNNDIVLISLYVDDRTKLPQSEQYESDLTGNTIKTYGQKWLEYQQKRYNTNAQPLYIIQDLEGNDLNDPVGYTPDANQYLKWLESGINAFQKD